MSVLDYPGKICAIVFTQGCNYRCPYCQNSSLLDNSEALLDEKEVLDYLRLRKNMLEGVTITGGEPTIHSDLEEFIDKVRNLGLDIKLDTNGTNPSLLKNLIDKGKLDYIAMDIKNSLDEYSKTIGVKNDRLEDIKRSIDIIKSSNVDHEFRTTITKELHTVLNLKSICELVKGSKYYIQNYEDSSGVLKSGSHGFTEDELKEIENELKKDYPLVKVRGIGE